MTILNLNRYDVLQKFCTDKGYKLIAYGDGRGRVKVINLAIPKYTVISYMTQSTKEIELQLKELELK